MGWGFGTSVTCMYVYVCMYVCDMYVCVCVCVRLCGVVDKVWGLSKPSAEERDPEDTMSDLKWLQKVKMLVHVQ